MPETGLRRVLATALVLGAIACRGQGDGAELAVRLEPGVLELTALHGVARQATIVATAAGEHPRLHLQARREGPGLAAVETSSRETYALVTVRTDPALAPGTYRGTLVVTPCLDEGCSRAGRGAPVRVPYAVTVVTLLATPNPVQLATAGGGAAAEADVAVTLPPGAAGFDVAVSSGDAWLRVVDRTAAGFRVNAAPRRRGTYQGALRLTAGGGATVVQVRCDVPAVPLRVTPSRLSFWAPVGAEVLEDVAVALPDDAVDFDVKVRASGWMTVRKKASGVSVEIPSLAPGAYRGSLTFTAGDATAIVPVEYSAGMPDDVEHGIFPASPTVTLVALPGQPSDTTYLRIYPPTGTEAVQARVEYPEGPSGWLELVETGPGFLVTAITGALAPGGYGATVILSAGASPEVRVPVAFTVGPGLVRPPDQEVVLGPGTRIVEDLRRGVPVELASMGTAAPTQRWRAGTDVPWLVLDEPAGWDGEVLVYSIDLAHVAAMSPGAETVGTVTISAEPPTLPPTRFQVRLTSRLGVIDGITPSAQPAGRTARFLVRGKGFGRPPDPAPQVVIDGVGAVAATRRSDAELELEVPALPAGTYTVRLVGPLDVPWMAASFGLFEPGALPPGMFDEDGAKRGLAWDPMRRALFYADVERQALVRYAYAPQQGWTVARRSLPGLLDVGRTPDGRSLLAATAEGVRFVDPDALDDRGVVPEPAGFAAAAASAGIPVTNDGIAWLFSPSFSFSMLDVSSRRFVRGPPRALLEAPSASVSRDGTRALFSQPWAQPRQAILCWDTGAGTVAEVPADVAPFVIAAQSDDGGRLILDGTRVYDRSFGLVGLAEAPYPYRTRALSGFGAALSPDGSRAYVLAYTPYVTDPPRLYAFDTRTATGASLPIVGARDLLELADEWSGVFPPPALMVVSPDDAMIFVATPGTLLALPTSSLAGPLPP